MGNLRRIENLIPLTVLFLALINPHPSEVFGYRAVLVVYFIIFIVFFGIFWNLAFLPLPKGDNILNYLVIAFLMTYILSIISALGLEKTLRLDEHRFIPFLFASYFLGIFADKREVPKVLPFIFMASSVFILLEIIVDIFKEYNPIFRFGYRNVFYTPFIFAISVYLMSEEKSGIRKILYFLAAFISLVCIVLFGNRTNYISLGVLTALIFIYAAFKGKSIKSYIINAFGTLSITGLLGLGMGYAMFGYAFLIYVFLRISTLFTPSETIYDPAAQIRIYDYSLAFQRFYLSPFFGQTEFDMLTRWIEGKIVNFVDSSFITVLWKMGIFGFTIYLALLIYSFAIVLKGVLRKDDFAFFTLLLFTSFLITSLTTTILIYYIHIAPLMICVGIVAKRLSDISH
ncbi:MAG: hypothetical protein ABIL26_07670 [candidate division WOR-3 bacterium]